MAVSAALLLFCCIVPCVSVQRNTKNIHIGIFFGITFHFKMDDLFVPASMFWFPLAKDCEST